MPLPTTSRVADHLHRVAGRELSLHLRDPDREQARAALAQHPGRALVDHDPPLARLRVAEPQLEARGALRVRREPRADPLAPGRSREAPRLRSVADHHRDPGRARHLRRRHLAAHPARAEGRRSVADPVVAQLREVVHLLDQLGLRVRARVGGVEPGRVREQDQKARLEQDRNLRGEEVVVAEGDLVGSRGVVLVHHRHHPPVEQPAQGLAGIQVVHARRHVERGQQHLSRVDLLGAESLLVGAEQRPLADRRRRLHLVDGARALVQLQQAHPPRDRSGGDEHHVLAAPVQLGHLAADAVEHRGAQRAVVVGDDRGPELGDHRHRALLSMPADG